MKLSPAMLRALNDEHNGGIVFGTGEPHGISTCRALLRRGLIEYSHSHQDGLFLYSFYRVTDDGKAFQVKE